MHFICISVEHFSWTAWNNTLTWNWRVKLFSQQSGNGHTDGRTLSNLLSTCSRKYVHEDENICFVMDVGFKRPENKGPVPGGLSYQNTLIQSTIIPKNSRLIYKIQISFYDILANFHMLLYRSKPIHLTSILRWTLLLRLNLLKSILSYQGTWQGPSLVSIQVESAWIRILSLKILHLFLDQLGVCKNKKTHLHEFPEYEPLN